MNWECWPDWQGESTTYLCEWVKREEKKKNTPVLETFKQKDPEQVLSCINNL